MNVQALEKAYCPPDFFWNALSGFSAFNSERLGCLTCHKYLLIPPQTLPLAHYEIYAIRFSVYEKRSRRVLQSLHCSWPLNVKTGILEMKSEIALRLGHSVFRACASNF